MSRMSNLTAFFFIWSCGFCYAVQVFVKGAHGMVSWKDTPSWRDRSVVPTPPPEDVAAYKKRGEIPFPYPREHVVKHVYVGPRASIGKGNKANKKKNLIQKIFFSLPVGAELPIYYTHKQGPSSVDKCPLCYPLFHNGQFSTDEQICAGLNAIEMQAPYNRHHKVSSLVKVIPGSHKKSTVANSEVTDGEGSRYFSEESRDPFRSNTWGLQRTAGNEELSPDLETRTIAKQNLLPSSDGGLRYHGIGGQYLRPRTVDRYRVFKNSGQFFKRPSRTQGILSVYRRSKTSGLKMERRDVNKTKKTALLKQSNESSKLEKVGYVIKGKDLKKSGLPKGETLDDIMTKLKPTKKV